MPFHIFMSYHVPRLHNASTCPYPPRPPLQLSHCLCSLQWSWHFIYQFHPICLLFTILLFITGYLCPLQGVIYLTRLCTWLWTSGLSIYCLILSCAYCFRRDSLYSPWSSIAPLLPSPSLSLSHTRYISTLDLYPSLAQPHYYTINHQSWIFFFVIISGTNISTGEEVAIKLECIKTRHPQLHIESRFYKMMQGGGM